MRLWRLVRVEHADSIDGEGARLFGGRWNSPGNPVVYASGTLSLALLEVWVNLRPLQRRAGAIPRMLKMAFDLPADVAVERHDPTPKELHDPAHTRAFGDHWLAEGRTVALSVPSAIIPEDANVLLNPRHPDFAQVTVAVQSPFQFDERLAI